MEKKIKIFGILTMIIIILVGTLLFLVVFQDNRTAKAELISYSTSTWKGHEKITDGLVYSEDATEYLINGSVKITNKASLNSIEVEVKFYNKNNSYLCSKYDSLTILPGANINTIPDTWKFTVGYLYFNEYFKEIDHVEIEITTA